MAVQSRIEWTESTWNPITGCTKISPGCKNCYAERMARRLHAMRQANYRNVLNLTCHPREFHLKCGYELVGAMPDALDFSSSQ